MSTAEGLRDEAVGSCCDGMQRWCASGRLRCLDHPVVDTGAEFASPSGAPPGYHCGSPIGEALPGLAEQRALVERIAQSGGARADGALACMVWFDGTRKALCAFRAPHCVCGSYVSVQLFV